MKTVIFLGPTLRRSEAESVLNAIYLPPVEQGSFLSAVESIRPDSIGIIDGVFLQDLSVWHKEILYALDKGISVWGGGSMGALRAAELASFGMHGIGWVFDQFMNGNLTDDDEVALTHASVEFDYKKLSEPLVNVRATLDNAIECQLLSIAQCELILEAAKSIYFADRTLAALLDRLYVDGAKDTHLISTTRKVFTSHYVDIKKQDALLLLDAIGKHDVASRQTHQFEKNALFRYLYENDRRVNRGDIDIDLSSVVRFASLHDPSFEESRFNAFNRHIAVSFAEILGIKSNQNLNEKELKLFKAKHRLEDETVFDIWLTSNDLSKDNFNELMCELATCRLVHTWWLSQAKRASTKSRAVLDQLRLEQRYESAADGARSQEELLGPSYKDDYAGTLESLFKELHHDVPVWPSSSLETWSSEVGFLNGEDLRRELGRSKAWRAACRNGRKPGPDSALET